MKVLATSSHPGGINAIVPVIKLLMADGKTDMIVIGHEFSEPILAKADIASKTIKDFGLPDISAKSMDALLRVVSPDLVLIGTASQEGKADDVLEHSVILASRNLGIKSLAVLDFWLDYWQRFTDERTDKKLALLPDRVAIMDELAKEDMLKEGFPEERLVITGNPHFDDLPARANSFTGSQRSELRQKVGLNCETLFFFAGSVFSVARQEYGYWDLDVLEVILNMMSELPNVGLAVRLHPRMPAPDKSQISELIGESGARAKLVEDIDSQTLVLVADLTICEFSTIGIEAVYMRRPTVSLQPDLRKKEDPLVISKKGIVPVGYTRESCKELLKKAVHPQFRADILNQSASFTTDGKATDRVVQLVYSLLEREVRMTITKLKGLSEEERFAAIQAAHRSFSSLLPGLETLGPGLRSAVAKAKSDPVYKGISEEEWQQIGMDLSDPRCYYVAGCGHIAPPDSKLEEYVRESADILLREKHR